MTAFSLDPEQTSWCEELRTLAEPAPGAGSDHGGRRLTGEKCWISGAPGVDFHTVFARTTRGAGARGVTAFPVPADRPGLTGTALDMLAPRPVGPLVLDGVPVTVDDVLGEPDRGFRVAMDTLNLFRPGVGAFAVGMARAVQLHGARALRRGHLLEHHDREVRAPRNHEGASEVRRTVIAKELYANREASA